MRITLSSVMVDDQGKALKFYADVLGFVLKNNVPVGDARWLTVVSPEAPDEAELLFEPNANAAAKTFQSAHFQQGIPLTAFEVADIRTERERLRKLAVVFRSGPTPAGSTTIAVFEGTCGNLTQMYEA